MPVVLNTKSADHREQIKARIVPRKSKKAPPMPPHFRTHEQVEAEVTELERLLNLKQKLIENRRRILKEREAEAKRAHLAKAKQKQAAKKPTVKTKPKVESKPDAKKSTKSSVAKRAKASKKTAATKTKASATKEKPAAQTQPTPVAAVSAKVPRRLPEPVTKQRGRKNTKPQEEVVKVATTAKVKAKRKTRKPTVEVASQLTAETLDYVTLKGDIPQYQLTEGEPYMSEPQLKHFRQLLHVELAEQNKKIEQTLIGMQEKPTIQADPLDQAHQEASVEIEMRARERENRAIQKIQRSIKSIDEGRYGYCESCQDEIGIRRLEARPTATQCIECKNIDEMEENRYG